MRGLGGLPLIVNELTTLRTQPGGRLGALDFAEAQCVEMSSFVHLSAMALGF